MKKSERLNQELIYLNGKKSFNIRDLMVEFNISKMTAIRDIQELEYMGLSLYTETGRYGKYNIVSDNILTPIHFNTEEIASIFFAIKAIENLSQTPFDKTYNQIYQKLFAILPENKKDMVDRITEAKNNLSIHNNRFHNIEFKCELTKYGKELFLKRNFYEMRLEEYDGKYFLVGNYNDEQLEYLTQYLISFRKQVKILYPDELISKYKLEILEMLNSY